MVDDRRHLDALRSAAIDVDQQVTDDDARRALELAEAIIEAMAASGAAPGPTGGSDEFRAAAPTTPTTPTPSD
jgi:hypothetical protein